MGRMGRLTGHVGHGRGQSVLTHDQCTIILEALLVFVCNVCNKPSDNHPVYGFAFSDFRQHAASQVQQTFGC